MNLNQLPICLLCAALGAGLVKVADRMVPEDTVTAKRVVVTTDEGKTIVQLDAAGVQVMGEEEGTFTQIKGNDRAQINIVKDSTTELSMGEGLVGNGYKLYHAGKLVASMSANEKGVQVAVAPPRSGELSLEDLFTSKKEPIAALIAQADGAVLAGVVKDGKEKTLVLPD